MSLTGTKLVLPKLRGTAREKELEQFSSLIRQYETQAAQKMTSRGWCYFLEGYNVLLKGDFNKAQNAINECRKKGYLPIRFVAEDPKRAFSGVEFPTEESPLEYLKDWLVAIKRAQDIYTPDWWDGEKYYLQMMVEKIDLVNMFEPVCKEYHVPIVNAGGWYDISERAEAAERFSDAESRGLTPVILYFGDFDPFGLAISDFIISNFKVLERGTDWVPDNLTVDRFGLNYDFIISQGLTWIDNLESGSGKDMARLADKNRIVREYLAKYGKRKCEANAVMRASARDATLQLCRDTIEEYLGDDAKARFAEKRANVRKEFVKVKGKTGLDGAIDKALADLGEAK